MALRLVLDTNVWLDWLVFDDPALAPLRAAVGAGAAEVLIDAACEEELRRVLARPLGKVALEPEAQAECLAECRRSARRPEPGDSPARLSGLPRCRDPHDQKFLELARAAGADALVTKDRALLELARRVPFGIVTPEALSEALAPEGD
jgi:uncharacterized protein